MTAMSSGCGTDNRSACRTIDDGGGSFVPFPQIANDQPAFEKIVAPVTPSRLEAHPDGQAPAMPRGEELIWQNGGSNSRWAFPQLRSDSSLEMRNTLGFVNRRQIWCTHRPAPRSEPEVPTTLRCSSSSSPGRAQEMPRRCQTAQEKKSGRLPGPGGYSIVLTVGLRCSQDALRAAWSPITPIWHCSRLCLGSHEADNLNFVNLPPPASSHPTTFFFRSRACCLDPVPPARALSLDEGEGNRRYYLPTYLLLLFRGLDWLGECAVCDTGRCCASPSLASSFYSSGLCRKDQEGGQACDYECLLRLYRCRGTQAPKPRTRM